jgi:hypothetical protein
MFEDLEILQKLNSIKKLLRNENEIKIIDDLISKRNIEINVDFEYTDKEMSGSFYVFKNILKNFYKEPEFWNMPDKNDTSTWTCDEVLYDMIEEFDKEIDKLIKKFSLLRIKNNLTKNSLTRQNSILIQTIFVIEAEKLIKKTFKNYDTSKH